MKLIKQNVKILKQGEGLDGIYKQIELAGRTCYKSENKITKDSSKTFVDRLINSKHLSVLEHGTIYLKIPYHWNTDIYLNESHVPNCIGNYFLNPYSKVKEVKEGDKRFDYITTNLRVIIENEWQSDLQYLCEPTEHHEKRITVKWICDRGVSHEFVRHRKFSFSQESTRYCDYSKDKFNKHVTFIIPTWIELKEGEYSYWDGDWCDVSNLTILKHYDGDITDTFLTNCSESERSYRMLINKGAKPQEARQVLSNALKTELMMTGFESDWNHFFSLRSPKAKATGVHPDAAYLADLLYDKLKQK